MPLHRPLQQVAQPAPVVEQRPDPPASAPPIHVHAPVTVHTDNRATVDALQSQATQMVALQAALQQLADKMTPGVLNVTVTEWTPMGRIKSLRITRG